MDESKPRVIDVGGIETSYLDVGEGPTILLVHGADFSGFGSGGDWARNVPGLVSAGFRVVVPDKLGHGRTASPPSPESYTMRAVIEHVRDFVAALGIRDYVLVGHSRGALPALHIALDAPSSLRALVLVDSNSIGHDSPLVPQGFYERLHAGNSEPPTADDVRRVFSLNSYADEHITAEFLDGHTAELALPAAVERRRLLATAGLHRSTFLPDVAACKAEAARRVDAGELQVDTLVVWGADDPSAPLPMAYELFGAIAAHNRCRTELHVINHAGHYCYREQPAAFNRAVIGFVARQ